MMMIEKTNDEKMNEEEKTTGHGNYMDMLRSMKV